MLNPSTWASSAVTANSGECERLCLVLLWIKLLNYTSVIHKWLFVSLNSLMLIFFQFMSSPCSWADSWTSCESVVPLIVLLSTEVRHAFPLPFFSAGSLRVFLCFWFVCTLLLSNSVEKWAIFPSHACSFWMDSFFCQVFSFYSNVFLWFYISVNPLNLFHHQNYWPLYKGLETWTLIQLHNWHFAVCCRY